MPNNSKCKRGVLRKTYIPETKEKQPTSSRQNCEQKVLHDSVAKEKQLLQHKPVANVKQPNPSNHRFKTTAFHVDGYASLAVTYSDIQHGQSEDQSQEVEFQVVKGKKRFSKENKNISLKNDITKEEKKQQIIESPQPKHLTTTCSVRQNDWITDRHFFPSPGYVVYSVPSVGQSQENEFQIVKGKKQFSKKESKNQGLENDIAKKEKKQQLTKSPQPKPLTTTCSAQRNDWITDRHFFPSSGDVVRSVPSVYQSQESEFQVVKGKKQLSKKKSKNQGLKNDIAKEEKKQQLTKSPQQKPLTTTCSAQWNDWITDRCFFPNSGYGVQPVYDVQRGPSEDQFQKDEFQIVKGKKRPSKKEIKNQGLKNDIAKEEKKQQPTKSQQPRHPTTACPAYQNDWITDRCFFPNFDYGVQAVYGVHSFPSEVESEENEFQVVKGKKQFSKESKNQGLKNDITKEEIKQQIMKYLPPRHLTTAYSAYQNDLIAEHCFFPNFGFGAQPAYGIHSVPSEDPSQENEFQVVKGKKESKNQGLKNVIAKEQQPTTTKVSQQARHLARTCSAHQDDWLTDRYFFPSSSYEVQPVYDIEHGPSEYQFQEGEFQIVKGKKQLFKKESNNQSLKNDVAKEGKNLQQLTQSQQSTQLTTTFSAHQNDWIPDLYFFPSSSYEVQPVYEDQSQESEFQVVKGKQQFSKKESKKQGFKNEFAKEEQKHQLAEPPQPRPMAETYSALQNDYHNSGNEVQPTGIYDMQRGPSEDVPQKEDEFIVVKGKKRLTKKERKNQVLKIDIAKEEKKQLLAARPKPRHQVETDSGQSDWISDEELPPYSGLDLIRRKKKKKKRNRNLINDLL